jgi:hypothetical protein
MLITTSLTIDAAPRRKASATWTEGPQDRPADYTPITLGRLYTHGRYRGAMCMPVGEGAADDVVSYRLWLADAMALRAGPRNTISGRVSLALLGTGTFTLSTMTGAAGDPVTDLMRYADTLTYVPATSETTPKGAGSMILAALTETEVQVYSPANNTPARLVIPDLGGGWAAAFEMVSDDAAKKGAMLVRLMV